MRRTAKSHAHVYTLTRTVGIGAAVVKQLARAGCRRIAITDINKEALKKCINAVKQDPERDQSQLDIFPLAGDISDEAFVSNLATTVKTEFGRIDYVVNCAGILGPALRTDETPIAVFDQINNINYKGTWLVNRKMLARMKTQEPLAEHPLQKGAIVNVASQLGIVGRPEAGKLRTSQHHLFFSRTQIC